MRIAAILRQEKVGLLDEWERLVRCQQTQPQLISSEELRDDIPHLIDRLIACLKTDSEDLQDSFDVEKTRAHAVNRIGHGITLRDLLREYQLLRRCMTDAVLRTASDETRERLVELRRLNDALDLVILESVATYSRHRDQQRDLVLGIFSHDLRNPLAAIKLRAAALSASEKIDDMDKRHAEVIVRSAARIQGIISDVADLARSRFGGGLPIHPRYVDVGEIAGDVVEELRGAHPKRKLALERRGDLRIHCDPVRMGQLLSNLLANALEHGEDPIAMEVVGESELRICVTNRGRPIPAQEMPSLFLPFRRIDERGEGLGLGLFIVMQIVAAHHGTVNVKSDETSTEFTARLPRY